MDRIIFHEQEWWARDNSAEALADAIERSAELKLASLGRAAALTAHRTHSWRTVFEQLFCIYREVCARYRGVDAI
jgi:hypothetical protein